MRTILMARRLDPPPTASSTKRSMGTVVTRSIENQPRRYARAISRLLRTRVFPT